MAPLGLEEVVEHRGRRVGQAVVALQGAPDRDHRELGTRLRREGDRLGERSAAAARIRRSRRGGQPFTDLARRVARSASVRRADRLRECRNRHGGNDRFAAESSVRSAPPGEPHRGHHHRCLLDRRHSRRRHLVRDLPLHPAAARGGSQRDLVATRDDLARDHDRRPLRPPDGDDLLRAVRRLGRPERPVREGHRRAVRLGDRSAAGTRHGHVPSSSAPRPQTSRTASASTTRTTSSSSRPRFRPTTFRRSSTRSPSQASTPFVVSSSAARAII